MKTIGKILITAVLIALATITNAQSVGINSDGSAPASSAMLDVSSTAKGFLAPRMTAEQKAAIISPATGLLVYQTDAPAGYYYNSGTPASPAWVQLGAASGASQWATTGSNVYYNTGNVGIGTTTPTYQLDLGNGTSVADRIRLQRGSDDVNQNLLLGWNNITVQRLNSTLSNGQTDFSIIQTGSDGSRTPFYIDYIGNVGIGTTSPTAKLDVSGEVNFSENLTINKNIKWANSGYGIQLSFATVGPKDALVSRSASGSQWVDVGSDAAWSGVTLAANGGNVGIGTTTPASKISAVNNNFDATTNPGFKFYGFQSSTSATVPLFHIQSGWENNLAANIFKVNTYQNEAGFNILCNGNVGIGTATPAYKLDVNGAINGTSVLVNGVPVASSTDTYWSANGGGKISYSGGNVGIGTTTPTAKLDVSASGEALRLVGDNNFLTFYNTANTVRTAYIQQNAGTNLDISTNGLPLILNQNGGNVGIGTSTPASNLTVNGATNSFIELQSAGSTKGYFWWANPEGYLAVGPGGGGNSIIFKNDNVGIGTTQPLGKLHIVGHGNKEAGLRITGSDAQAIELRSSTDDATYIDFAKSSTDDSGFGTPDFGGRIMYNGVANSMQFATNGVENRVIIDGSGNVGIGTTTPSSKLHIAGADMNNALLFENTSANPGRNFILFKTQETEQGYIGLGGGATNHMSVAAYGASNNIFLETNGTAKMTVLPNGNVGIGTATPTSQLMSYYSSTVNPSLTWDSFAPVNFRNEGSELVMGLSATSPYPYYLQARTSGSTGRYIVINPLGGNVGIGTTTPYTTLTVGSTDATAKITAGGSNTHLTLASAGPAGNIYLNAGGVANDNYSTSTRLSVGADGNVGIGTTTPVSKLHVNGDISIPSSGDPGVQGGMIRAVGGYGSVTNIPAAIEFRRDNASYTGEEGQIRFKTTNVPTATPPDRMVILGNGNVGIGTTTPDVKLKVVTSVADYTALISNTLGSPSSHGLFISNGSNSTGGATMVGFFRPDGTEIGSITQNTATTVAYNTTSDYRLKDNIVNTHFSLNDLMKIQVRDYVYKADAGKTQVTGFIAQELYEIFPNAVSKPTKPEDMWSVDYGKVTPLLVKAIQDQQITIEAQQKQIDMLKAQNTALAGELKAEIEAIKKAINGSTAVVRIE